jgi:mRNA interferase HigB
LLVRIIKRSSLAAFWQINPDAEQPLRAWYAVAKRANWRSSVEVKEIYRSASIVGSERVVFDIGGNEFRLVVAIKYSAGIIFVKFVGRHNDYDRIDAAHVDLY